MCDTNSCITTRTSYISIFVDILSKVASELLILSLDLVKNQVVVMSIEMRKSFFGQILVGLIEKTPQNSVIFHRESRTNTPNALKKAKTL